MDMHGAERTLDIDGRRFESLVHVGTLEDETWHEFRVLRSNGSIYTLLDHGVVGQFDRPPAEPVIEAPAMADVMERAHDYAHEFGLDAALVRERLEPSVRRAFVYGAQGR